MSEFGFVRLMDYWDCENLQYAAKNMLRFEVHYYRRAPEIRTNNS